MIVAVATVEVSVVVSISMSTLLDVVLVCVDDRDRSPDRLEMSSCKT